MRLIIWLREKDVSSRFKLEIGVIRVMFDLLIIFLNNYL